MKPRSRFSILSFALSISACGSDADSPGPGDTTAASVGGATSSGGTVTSSAGVGGAANGTATSGMITTGEAAATTGGTSTTGGDVELDASITVDAGTRFQTIDGFGAALPMWVSGASGMLTTDQVRKAVGMGDDELGLSILRTMLGPDSDSWSYAVSNLQEAKAYGASVQILASPWSPPAHMKSNGSLTDGGKLLPEYYDDYASHLNDYVQYMAGQGVSIDVVSVQNEPDWHPDYDSCDWTGEELRDFVSNNAPAIQSPKILVGESLRFDRAYTDPSLNDSVAVNNFDLVGGHLYSAESTGFFTPYPLAEQKGKGRWMTEWLSHEADGEGAAIWGGDNQAVWDETLDVMLRSVHISMDVSWNAYIWWWMRRYYSFIGDGESAYGTQTGEILKRGWAFSQYSKFVRPGYTRVGVSTDDSLGSVNLTAYEGDSRAVVVMLNRSTDQYNDVVVEAPQTLSGAEAYATSRSQNRAAIEVKPQGRYATVSSIAPRSVLTVVMSY